MERLLDVAMFLLLVAFIPLIYAGPLVVTFPWIVPSGIVISVIIVVTFGGVITFILRPGLTDRFLVVCTRFLPGWISGKMNNLLHAFLDGFKTLTRPRHLVLICALTILVWCFYAGMTYTAFYSLRLQDRLDFASAIVVLAVASVGVAIPTPGGTGSYHVLTSQALTKLFGIDAATALSYATLTHALSFIGVSIVGGYFLLRDQVKITEAIKLPGKER